MPSFYTRLLLGIMLHLSHEPGELLQCQCHDDSTTNIDTGIILL